MVGRVVILLDEIDPSIRTKGTICFEELDDEIDDLFWFYIRANDQGLNTEFDYRFGNYYKVVASTSEYLFIGGII